jgi:DNA-binding transcriptional regulator/RsmH inhibitor MraZ
VSITHENNLDLAERLSLPQSLTEEISQTPVIPFYKEVTKSDIKLEGFNENIFDEKDPNFMHQPFEEEDVTVAI